MINSQLPTEVELVYEVMPCNAMRTLQEPFPSNHPCTYFRQWGSYHSFDYIDDGIPNETQIPINVHYVGRSTLIPEILSGCRKSPIMAVGINPNLPGWFPNKRGALNPLFDNYKQYAHYFRYRSTAKLIVTANDYYQFGGGNHDTPFANFILNVPLNEEGKRVIRAEYDNQSMYIGYLGLLESLAERMGWNDHQFSLSEDFSYLNMVACPSAKWRTTPDPVDPQLPHMTTSQRNGIVQECFHERKHFFRQLFQSLPKVLIVFSQSTANAFIKEMKGNFTLGNPVDGERIDGLLERHIRLKYGTLEDGTSLDARVIFSPHISGNPDDFNRLRDLVLNQLLDEAQNGGLTYNNVTKHLNRSKGSCSFCPMLEIGECNYLNEIENISSESQSMKNIEGKVLINEKQFQTNLLHNFIDHLVNKENFWIEETDNI